MSGWTANYTHYEVTEALQKAGVSAMPSFSNKEIFDDPHFRARGLATEVDHPTIGKSVVLGAPWRLSGTPATVTSPAPTIGQHNEYVFGELLGLSTQEIQRLVEAEVIY